MTETNLKLKVAKKALVEGITQVQKAICDVSPIASLRCIKMEAKEDTIILTGSDSSTTIKTVIQKDDNSSLNIEEEGAMLLNSKNFGEMIKKADSEEISLEAIGNLLKVRGASIQYKINSEDVKNYPDINLDKPDDSITVSADMLVDLIEKTTFACSKKETRPVLTGVNFALANKKMVVTATDSYRLTKKIDYLETDSSFDVTIPAKSLAIVKDCITKTGVEEIVLAVNDKKAQFLLGDLIFQTSIIDGTYPQTDRLIPTEFNHTLVIDKKVLHDAIDRMSFIKNDNMAIDKLSLSKDSAVLSNKSREIGESREELATAKFTGDDLTISFLGQYVLDALKALSGESVKISFVGDMKPFILSSLEDDSITELVLPVRTYN